MLQAYCMYRTKKWRLRYWPRFLCDLLRLSVIYFRVYNRAMITWGMRPESPSREAKTEFMKEVHNNPLFTADIKRADAIIDKWRPYWTSQSDSKP